MAIIKKAKNINIQVANNYTSISKISHEQSEKVIIEATKKNLELSSQKRAIMQGFGKESDEVKQRKITEIQWTYGEDNTILSNSSKFFVDMNLVVQTEGYDDGETININIKSDDGKPIADGVNELNLMGQVDKDGIVIFKEPLKNYTLNLLIEEEVENI